MRIVQRARLPIAARRALLVVVMASSVLAVGAIGNGANAGSSSSCAGDPTPTKVVVSSGNPYLAVAMGASPTTQYLTLCYSTGHESQTSYTGGVIHLLAGNSGASTAPWASAQVWCFPDGNLSGPSTLCYTGEAVWVYQPTVQQVDEPGSNDVFYRVTWGFGMCTVGCTTSGDSTEKTGAVVGTFGVSGGPAGSQGASLVLQSTEVWFDGALVRRVDGAALAGAGVGHTGTPGAPQTTVTPNAAGPCVAGVCSPAYQVWVPGYGNSVSVSAAGTTRTESVGIPTTGNGRLCVIDSDTGNCA